MGTSSSGLPILYSFRRCPYAMRARLALRYAGIQVVLREVALRDKPQALRDISPKATVPVLQLPDGSVLDQSLTIMEWALQRSDRCRCRARTAVGSSAQRRSGRGRRHHWSAASAHPACPPEAWSAASVRRSWARWSRQMPLSSPR